ncbi:MAG: 6-phospho-beta-glucosidase [Defluviitaleaceae bacterium]|nr:6-phospho-beta-glucosidase [Defluviitaleaceae bacterium]
MKLAVIGGGGVRSMFLAKSLVRRAGELGIREIVFMDDNRERLEIYGQMAAETANRIDPSIVFQTTSDARAAISGSDYVITTIRVGGDHMRIQDERIALSHGVLGQETTGAAGFSFAMRSIPALVRYCELIKEVAKPGAKMFNFTNPAGLVSQTLRDMGFDFTFGICDAPSGLLHEVAALYGVEPGEVGARCFGLNHLSFFNSISVKGREVLGELIEDDRLYTHTEMKYFDKNFTRRMGLLLNEYLYYYFSPETPVSNITGVGATRGELIKDINISMTEELSGLDIRADFDRALAIFEKWYGKRDAAYMSNETGKASHKPPFKFDIQGKEAGGYAGVALKFIEAARLGKEAEMILCVPNGGAIPWLEDSDIVEISCAISQNGYVPHRVDNADNLPILAVELVRRVKVYERLAAQALRQRCKNEAVESLALHPLVNSYSRAESIFGQYMELNKEYTGEWT